MFATFSILPLFSLNKGSATFAVINVLDELMIACRGVISPVGVPGAFTMSILIIHAENYPYLVMVSSG